MNIFQIIKFYENIVGKRFYLILIGAVTVGITEVVGIASLTPLIEMLRLSENKVRLWSYNINWDNYIIIVMFIFVIKTLITYYYYNNVASTRALYYELVKNKILKLTLRKDYSTSRENDNGKIVNVFTEQAVNSMLGLSNLALLFLNLNFFILFVIYLAYISIDILIFLIILGCVIGFIFKKINIIMKKESLLISNKNKEISNDFLDILNSIKYIKSTNKIEFPEILLKKEINYNSVKERKVYEYHGLIQTIKDPIILITLSFVCFYALNTNVEPEKLLIILFILYKIVTSLISLQSSFQKSYSLVGCLKEINEIISIKNDKKEIFQTDTSSIKKIELKNVSYQIKNKKILKNINITIFKNDKLALFGPSGCGKSTLINILLGLLKQSSGEIFIDGIFVNEKEQNNLRQKIGFVTQEQCLFSKTLKENILFGNSYDDRKFWEIIKICDLYKKIDSLELKENTILINNGSNFSGGEKQKIFLARELYADREILILDEPTSAMDNMSETKILKVLNDLEKTIILISHNMSALNICNKKIELKIND